MTTEEADDGPIAGNHKLARLQPLAAAPTDRSVLVVDDSRSVRALLCGYLAGLGGFNIEAAESYAQARELVESDPERFFCAALDLHLPDAPNGEIVDLVAGRGIPVIVLTGSVDEATRETMLSKQIIDYVVKRNTNEIEHVAYLVGRLRENLAKKVLVVDDSLSFRGYVKALLGRYRYPTFEAAHGKEAMEIIRENPDICLVITDVNMPEMDGFELIAAIRSHYRREDMAIIGLSDSSRRGLSALLLKSGANDFLAKPFAIEEFYCRVTQNTNMVGYVRHMRDSATRDYLTGVRNRRYLFEMGDNLHANALRGNIHIAAGVIDADHFKRINDTHGHQAGDEALRLIASTLQKGLRKTDIIARYGGEEFVCIPVVKKPEDAAIVFERMRAAVAEIDFRVNDQRVPLSVSIGVTTDLCKTLDEMLKLADQGVYVAKESGRNQVAFVPDLCPVQLAPVLAAAG